MYEKCDVFHLFIVTAQGMERSVSETTLSINVCLAVNGQSVWLPRRLNTWSRMVPQKWEHTEKTFHFNPGKYFLFLSCKCSMLCLYKFFYWCSSTFSRYTYSRNFCRVTSLKKSDWLTALHTMLKIAFN